MSRPVRRSRRTRKVNTRYANDGWDETTLRLLQDSDISDTSPVAGTSSTDSDANDDEFRRPQRASKTERSQDLHTYSPDQPPSDTASPTDSDDAASVVSGDDSTEKQSRNSYQKQDKPKQEGVIHSRGLQDLSKRLGKRVKYQLTFGPEVEDLRPHIAARDYWHLRGRDAILPSRATLLEAVNEGHSKLASPRDESAAASENHFVAFTEAAARVQRIEPTTIEVIRAQGYGVGPPSHKVVLGPWKDQTAYEISTQNSLNFGYAWEKSESTNLPETAPSTQTVQNEPVNITAEADDSSDSLSKSSKPGPAYHHGWIINVGEKVRCLAWAPYVEADTQYLAIICRSTSTQRKQDTSTECSTGTSPAFSPSASYPAVIQIWGFRCKFLSNHRLATLDKDIAPELRLLLTCNSGGIREAKWMPTKQSKSLKDGIGWLTTLSTDGCVRVFHVPCPSLGSAGPLCLHLVQASVVLRPPGALIYTTITLASALDLVVGASDGSIHLYNLAQVAASKQPQPFLSFQPHQTYVLSLATAGLGDLSHYLVSSSAANDLVLTDLRNPTQDAVRLTKSRLPTKNLVYCPCSQAWITTVDPSGRTDVATTSESRVIAHGLRHFYAIHQLSRFPQNSGSATVLASSTHHPYILVGNSQGTVMCQNVTRRLSPAAISQKPISWVQKLFEYYWISAYQSQSQESRGEEAPDNLQQCDAQDDLYHGRDTRQGVSRFIEGYKAERHDMTVRAPPTVPKTSDGRWKEKKRKATTQAIEGLDGDSAEEIQGEQNGTEGNVKAEVIFEEEQAVTAAAWNGSSKCAGWAAIGWGSGIVRIQDLSHEAI